jgi:allantoicase
MDFTELIDLASERLGGAVLAANDEFFAPKENLLKSAAPVFIEGRYTDRGKWMDGWETRRKRGENLEDDADWCLIRLGLPGIIRGVVVDTSFFRGNYPSHCALDACAADGQPDAGHLPGSAVRWIEVLPKSALLGDSQNRFAIQTDARATHLRLRIYPDGGVARLRVYGEVLPDWERLLRRNSEIDLAAVENGAMVVAASDMFFGHRHNLIMPGRALNMGDGWETRRRRGPGHDWCIIRLGRRGIIERIEVDTTWFRGNYPESCSIEACDSPDGADPAAMRWQELLPRTKLQGHTRHHFEDEIAGTGPATHLRLNICPDGGVSRLRVYGRITQ